jgi:F-type H+-transporting ATPase subunit b
MLIDWFTVGAQMLNFLILVWLLKRFLYKPVLNAIDAREKGVAAELADAATTRTAAQRERVEFERKSTALDEQRSVLLSKAADEAKAERDRLFAQAQQAAEALRAKHESAMRNDQMRLGREITRMAQEEIFGIARKALAHLAMADLEERMGEVFTRRLKEMDGKAKESLALALKTSSESVVRSAFDMPDTQRAAIQNALNETFSADVRIRFETSPNTICGIEWAVGEQKLAWSIAEYLAGLENKVRSLVDAQAMPAARSAPDATAAQVTRVP